jgi:hypothetical protein
MSEVRKRNAPLTALSQEWSIVFDGDVAAAGFG